MIHSEREYLVVKTEDRFLDVKQLAARYGVTVQTIYAWNHKGTGPRFIKAGRLPRYRLSDCEAWESTRYADGGGEAA
jgi:predicted DNA-binding transcriptional regulator AlpA